MEHPNEDKYHYVEKVICQWFILLLCQANIKWELKYGKEEDGFEWLDFTGSLNYFSKLKSNKKKVQICLLDILRKFWKQWGNLRSIV